MQKYFNTIVNDSGTGLNGALVRVTQSSGIVASIYSDNGVTPAANPLISDGSGNFQFYVADGTYTLTITYNGKVVKTLAGVVLGSDAASNEDLTALAANLTNINAAASNLSAINTAVQNIAAIQGAAGNAQAAATSATAAQSAQTAAEAARDSVNTTGKVFADTATGIAGTTNAQSFAVITPDLTAWIVYKNNAGIAAEIARSYTKSYLDGLIRSETGNSDILAAHVDANRRIGWVLLTDLTFSAKFALGAKNGLNVGKKPNGRFQLQLGTVEGVMPLGGGFAADSRAANYGKWLQAFMDVGGRLGGGLRNDGVTEFPKASVGVLLNQPQTLDTPNYLVYVDDVGNTPQIFTVNKATGLRKQLTTGAGSYNPVLLSDGSSLGYTVAGRIRKRYYQPLAGGTEYPLTAGLDLFVAWGDSLTAGTGSNGGAGGAGWVPQLETSIGHPVNKQGAGGQSSYQIAFRQGGWAPSFDVQGGALPSGGGSVTVTLATTETVIDTGTPKTIANPAAGALDMAWTGALGGVPGTLTFAGTSGTVTFTAAAGAVGIAAPTPVRWVRDRFGMDEQTQLLWLGRNNFAQPQQVLADIAACVAYLKPYIKRFLILSIINGDTSAEWVGGANYNQIMSLNAQLAALYPNNYADVRSPLVAAYNPSIAQDVTDHGHDVPPSSLRAPGDFLHLGDAGYAIVKNVVRQALISKGWA